MKLDGKLIKDTRKLLQMSQEELADGVTTQATISMMENRNIVPKLKILVLVCQRLHLTIEQLIKIQSDIDIQLIRIENLLLDGKVRKGEGLLEEIKEKQLHQKDQVRYFRYLKAFVSYLNQKDDDVLFYTEMINRNHLRDRNTMMSCLLAGAVWNRKNDLEKARHYFDDALSIVVNLKQTNSVPITEQIYILETYADHLINDGDFNRVEVVVNSALKILRENNSTYHLANIYKLQAQAFSGLNKDPDDSLSKAKLVEEM